ncbi:AbrB/MazE/SpoVT family DNA-binding domain-containing protein [uncultured Arcticibacterium sp.]|uniref:AbrB/MazE/SpoVT family DNA-binding domain-containing protein n=1 Tax=uncultured Arcticibacterium sp. TaxID=2173042 RepID=UPI0030FB34D6
MIQQIRKIGNSNGIILPKAFLDALNIDNNVQLELRNNEIIISPIKIEPREDWSAKFEKAIENGELAENDLFENLENDFDTEEW